MSILSANLKHLYQRRIFWLLGLLFAGGAAAIAGMIAKAVARNKPGAFCAPVLWMIFVGTIVAILPIDVLTKPFSYCLPGHRDIPRKFLFSVGLVLSFLWSLSFLFFPGLNPAKTVLACLSAWATFTMFYWLGAWIVFRFRNSSVVFALFPLLILLNMSTPFVDIVVGSPLPVILLGGLVNVLAWQYWGRPDLARRYCSRLWMGTFDAWNPQKIAKFKYARLAEKDRKKPNAMRISPVVEEFFLSRIHRVPAGTLPQYIWGGFYKTFGLMISQQRQNWMRSLLGMLPILCFLCYMPGPGMNMIFFIPGVMVAFMSLNIYSSLLISGSRRERFWSALTLAAATAILITLLVTLLAALSILLGLILPELTIKGYTLVFHPLTMTLFFVPLVLVPFTLTIALLFPGKPLLTVLVAMVPFQILLFLTVFQHQGNRPAPIGSVSAIIMLLGAWALFVTALRHISLRCSLVHQTR